jgi:RNA polymerase sigma-70 factor (ECF subfamily)
MSNSQSDSASYIRGCSEDIEKAFWQVWQHNRDYLYRCCFKWMRGNPTDAEEVLSRAMLKAWDKLPDHAEKITNLRAWLTRLTRNLCIDIHRERRRKSMQMENIEEVAARENSAVISCFDSPEVALLHHELGQYIRRAIDTLPSRLRTSFILHYYHQISYQDIAQQLALSLDNVYKRIQQAREIIQKRLSRYFSGLDEALLDSSESNTARDTSSPTPLLQGEGSIAPAYPGGNGNWKLASPLTKGGLRGVKARCEESDETMISDSQAAIATGCMDETIHYHVTASCLETLHSGWYRSLSPLGWS